MTMKPVRAVLKRFYEYWKAGTSRLEVEPSRVSSPIDGFVEVSRDSIAKELSLAWQDSSVPQRQYEECVVSAINNYRAGGAFEPFDVLVEILSDNVPDLDRQTILEVGCSSGYYFEAFKMKGIHAKFCGCDSSESFIALARKNYPTAEFHVQDARRLSYDAASFNIVVSGGCLPCILEYEDAIAESARVARDYVVFHRTPVFYRKKTSYYLRTAYGLKMFEIRFNERELLKLWRRSGLTVVDAITFEGAVELASGDFWGSKTYLCRKG
jgi:2-polyprenyl-3-methyl-5-hydroxy-6-metoxy-1,4-benzoquinol methylase